MTLIHNAVERFRHDHNRLPESLEELLVDYLESVPEDPFSGEPIHYGMDDNSAIISSAGDIRGDPIEIRVAIERGRFNLNFERGSVVEPDRTQNERKELASIVDLGKGVGSALRPSEYKQDTDNKSLPRIKKGRGEARTKTIRLAWLQYENARIARERGARRPGDVPKRNAMPPAS